MKKSGRLRGLVLVGAIALSAAAWQSWRWWQWASSAPQGSSGNSEAIVRFEVPPGTPGSAIGVQLERQGLIRSARAWRVWTWWQDLQKRPGTYQAGTYALSAERSMSEVANQIWEGDTIELSFTIPEGWSRQEMAAHFESLGFFRAEAFLAATENIPRDAYPWLPPQLPHLEGFLFPDTYQIKGDRLSPERTIELMLERFEAVALPLYEQHGESSDLSLLEWVALSSIVEKEAVLPEERSLIAGVFANRLERGMRLEADPTVEYALGIRQSAEQPLTYAQVRTPSPYNTYLNSGLPPTAIASPGRASLEATLFPANTDYLFFVARYDGSHIFSKTLEEHYRAQRAVQRK